MSTPTAPPAPYTSLGDLQGYKDLPLPVRSFVTYAATARYELCGSTTSQISRASCFAQYPDASGSLMAQVNTDNSIWTYKARLQTAAAVYIPSVSSVYSEWLGQEAVQAMVTTILVGDMSTRPTISVSPAAANTASSANSANPANSANVAASRPDGNGFDRLSIVEKAFAIIGVVVGVVVPIGIYLLTRRHLRKKEAEEAARKAESNGSGSAVPVEGKKKNWTCRWPIARN